MCSVMMMLPYEFVVSNMDAVIDAGAFFTDNNDQSDGDDVYDDDDDGLQMAQKSGSIELWLQ